MEGKKQDKQWVRKGTGKKEPSRNAVLRSNKSNELFLGRNLVGFIQFIVPKKTGERKAV